MKESAGLTIGMYIKAIRLKAGLSQWDFCRKLDYHIRNIQRIEAGHQDPQLDSVLKMISALGYKYTDFFDDFTDRSGLQPKGQGLIPHEWQENTSCDAPPSVAAYYGYKLRQVRIYFKISQANLSERASYCLRSINKLEAGNQMPRITAALKLVVATSCDVAWFFDDFPTYFQSKSE